MYKYKSLQDVQLPREHLSFLQNFIITKYLKQEVDDDLSICVDERSPSGLPITRDIKIYQCKGKKKQINLYYVTYFYMILYDFINCSAFVDSKQTLCYKLAIE